MLPIPYMNNNTMQERPPYVRFEMRDVEDRNESMKAGRTISKDKAFAYVLPPGSKDEQVKIPEEWLDTMRKQAAMPGREYLFQWFQHFSMVYEEWKKGNEIPETGTAIRSCPIFRSSEVNNLLGANIRTLEDLDRAGDDAMSQIGPDARVLQQKARDYIKAGTDKGVMAEEMSALKSRIETLESLLKDKDEKLQSLGVKVSGDEVKAYVPAPEPIKVTSYEVVKRKPGRPRKAA